MPMRIRNSTAVIFALCVAHVCSCGTTYQPRSDARIAITMKSGRPMLERDGLKFSSLPFSSEPVQAVEGNVVAEDHARTYIRRSRLGLALDFGGLAMVFTGIAINELLRQRGVSPGGLSSRNRFDRLGLGRAFGRLCRTAGDSLGPASSLGCR